MLFSGQIFFRSPSKMLIIDKYSSQWVCSWSVLSDATEQHCLVGITLLWLPRINMLKVLNYLSILGWENEWHAQSRRFSPLWYIKHIYLDHGKVTIGFTLNSEQNKKISFIVRPRKVKHAMKHTGGGSVESNFINHDFVQSLKQHTQPIPNKTFVQVRFVSLFAM